MQALHMLVADGNCCARQDLLANKFSAKMTAKMPSAPTAQSISPEHWAWVRDLIREIEREEQRDKFLQQLFQWDLAVREFRKVELARMILGDPEEKDFHYHAICLHSLLAIGHSLILLGETFTSKEFEHCCVEHAHIEAYVEELEQSFREWHHGFSAQEMAAARAKMFGGSA